MVADAKIKINNMPDKSKKYVVCRLSGSTFWFWGSYDTEEQAIQVAVTINGIVAERI